MTEGVISNYFCPNSWIEEIIGKLNELEINLLTLPSTAVAAGETTWKDWSADAGNKSSYDAVLARIRELRSFLRSIDRNSQQATLQREALNKLQSWQNILTAVETAGEDGFTRSVRVGSGFSFDTGKETKVKISKRDRLADAGTSPTTEEVVTVVCSSPFSISAGFGFSTVDEKEFVFVPSTKTVTTNGQTTQQVINRFGFKNNSSFRTLPILLLNTRFYEPNDTFAFHASTGAAVDIKTGQSGTDLEFIVGGSISFKRSLFITPGWHFGRVTKLAGGFQLDQEVPTGISEVPIEKSWCKGFAITFTYKIK